MLIKDLRERKRLTQKKLADLLNLPYQSIQKWESGEGTPTTKQILSLASALDTTAEVLLSYYSGKIPGNTASLTTQLYELVYELPLIANVNQQLTTLTPQQAREALVKGTYKVLMPNYELTNNHVIIQIEGDSMAPEIKHGAYVLAEAIENGQFKNQQAAVFAVLYSGGFIVNRIRSNDLGSQHQLKLFSDNEKFGEVTIPENEVFGMWKVLMKVQERVS